MNKVLLTLCLLCYTQAGMAQQKVSGRVISAADSTALPGATVVVKGTTTGTVTDATGYFTLPSVPDNSTLRVSFLGYREQEVQLGNRLTRPLVIALQQNTNRLREVVVSTGYQQLPQERATGSFELVGSEQLNQQVSTDVLSRLPAVASGLTVDRGTSTGGRLMIRGLSTIMGPREPLIVVDNFPYEGDINNINPNDVASVTLLKDAAAASIWGARAGNGVIVITTKKGRFNQPLRLEFNSSVSMAGKPDLSYIPQMTSSDFIDMELFLYGKGYYNRDISSSNRPSLTPVVELLVRRDNGSLTDAEAEAQLNALRQVDVRDEFGRHMYQRSRSQQYSLGLQGGSASNAWRVSLGYDRNLSHLDASYDRANLQLHNTIRAAKHLALSTGLYYTLSRNKSGKPGYGDVTMLNGNLYPYARFADAAGNPLPVVKDIRQSYKETAGDGRLLDWNYYPLLDYRHSRTESTLQDVTGNLGLSYTLPWGLAADLRYQYQRQQTTTEQHDDAQSYAARHQVNLFTQIDPATGHLTHAVPVGGILSSSDGLVQAHSARGQLSFDKGWDRHQVAAIAGGEIRHAGTTGSSSRLYGFDAANYTFGQVDYTIPYPLLHNGRSSYILPGDGIQRMANRFVSVYGNAAYTFRERYILSASARRDASNLFGVQANDRWKPLWSTGVSWRVSDEKFYPFAFLPTLKVRATYGFSGNVDVGRAAVATIAYRPNLSPLTASPMAYFTNYANPGLRWETSRMLNFGLDFGFRNNRVTGSLEYFRKKGTDLFGRQLIDYTSGIGSSVVKNVAAMKGAGLDLKLSSQNLHFSGFRWNTDLNFSYYRDEIIDNYLSNQRGSSFISSFPGITGLPGQPVYGVYSYRWAGLDPATGDPQGYLDGTVSKDYAALRGSNVLVTDLKYHGSALPVFFGSLGNTFSLGGLSVTARLSYKLGYYFRRSSVHYSDLYRKGTMHRDFADRWQQPGDEKHTTVPSMSYPANLNRDAFYAGSEVLVERGDHIRLEYVTASYDFTKKNARWLPLQHLQAYASVHNLGLLWAANKKNLDPDYHLGSFALPPVKTYSLGLRTTF